MSKWHSLTDGDYDMLSGGKTVIVKCSDGEIECSGTMKTQDPAYD